MAYDASQGDNEQQPPIAGSAPLSNQPQTGTEQAPQGPETPQGGDQAGGQAPSSSQQQNPNKAPQRASSGMFTNIQNYISKNQPQSAKMADAASKSMEQTAQAVQGKAGQLGQRFEGMAAASAPKNLDTAVDTVKTAAQQAAEYQAQPDQTAPQFDTSKDDEIRDILNMQYKGPTDLRSIQGYGDVSNEANKAQQLMDTVRSGDRSQLLKQMFGQNQDYTSGQRNLDDLVLGKNIAQVQDTVQQLGPMSGVLDQAQQQASAFAQERADEILGVRDQSRGALQQIAELRAAEVDKRLSQTVDNWDAMPEYMRDVLRQQAGAGATLTADEMSMLGLGADSNLYGALSAPTGAVNPNTGKPIIGRDNDKINEFIQSSGAADRQALTTQQEFDQLSRLQALTNLAQGGLGFGDTLSQRNIDLSDRSLVGQKTIDDAIDKGNIQNILGGYKTAYDKTSNKLEQKAKDLTSRHNQNVKHLKFSYDQRKNSPGVSTTFGNTSLRMAEDRYAKDMKKLQSQISDLKGTQNQVQTLEQQTGSRGNLAENREYNERMDALNKLRGISQDEII
jgi:hypothetical protein